MKKVIFLVLFFIVGFIHAQKETRSGEGLKDTLLFGSKRGVDFQEEKITVTDYKIISIDRDTTYLDTSLTIQKEYRYNYLRKDNFELLPFSNLGQTYNALAYTFRNENSMPLMGARSKHYNYMSVNDISYYHVPTPTTDLFFKTAMEQGQLLDAFVTLNTSRQLNFSIAYKGLRSLGKYQHILSSTGNFRFTANYLSKNNKYNLRLHFVGQDILNQENGGISNRSQFESGDPEFTNRARMDVYFQDAENMLRGIRYFVDQEYNLLRSKDSVRNTALRFGHRFVYETKYFDFKQQSANEYFGEAYTPQISDRARLQTMNNKFYIDAELPYLGKTTINASANYYNYYFNTIRIDQQGVIPNGLRDTELSLGAQWNKKIGNLSIQAQANQAIIGSMGGTQFFGNLLYRINDRNRFIAGVHATSQMPNFNFLLYHSDYKAYNWYNRNQFNKENRQGFQAELKSEDIFNASMELTNINNYTYFGVQPVIDDESVQVAPGQYSKSIQYLKLKINREFKLGKFALDNTIMYQKVGQEDPILNVPEFVTRNTLYFTDYLFKKAMYLQTGVTLNYFTEFYANSYNPLLGNFLFRIQKKSEIIQD